MENWKDVVGFVGYYEVSDLGNVRRKGKTKTLSQTKGKDGYIVHVLSVNAKRYNVFAHRLVLEAFVGPRPTNNVSRHKNGIRHQNNLSNLEYGTPAENSADMLKHNTQAKGESCGRSKLTEQDVLQIRASNETHEVLASRFNVSLSNIYAIKSRATWKHI